MPGRGGKPGGPGQQAAGGGEWPSPGGQSPANSISKQAGHPLVSFGLASGSSVRDCPAKSRSPQSPPVEADPEPKGQALSFIF